MLEIFIDGEKQEPDAAWVRTLVEVSGLVSNEKNYETLRLQLALPRSLLLQFGSDKTFLQVFREEFLAALADMHTYALNEALREVVPDS